MEISAPPRDRDRSARPRAAAIVAVAALALAACGIREETPPPEPPSPGPVEVVRQDAALAAAAISGEAGPAAAATDDEQLYAVLERVRLDAEIHLEALGGVYSAEEGGVVDPATATELAAPDQDAAQDDDAQDDDAQDQEPAPAPADPADLVSRLTDAAAAARAAADRTEDAGLAQLLAVVATARLLAADALARHLDAERPSLGGAGLPTALPAGPGSADLATLVLAEDQAAFAFETIAARAGEGRVRNRALTSAERHRATSDAWARLAGLDEPGLDPRATAYALQGATDTPESRTDLAARVETALVTSYAALVTLAEPGHRAELAELHTLAAESARRWGAALGPLPGLPEPAEPSAAEAPATQTPAAEAPSEDD